MPIFGFLTDAVKDFFADFKESSRVYKIKAGLIGGYLTVGLATWMVFVPPGDLNEIDGAVKVRRTDSMVGGTFFKIHNRSSGHWTEIQVTLNGTYQTRWPKIRAGKNRAIFAKKMLDEAGLPPPEDLQNFKLRVDTKEGAFEACFKMGEGRTVERVRCGLLRLR